MRRLSQPRLLLPALLLITALLTFLFILSGCNKNSSTADDPGKEVLLIAPQDLFSIQPNPFASGPSITGSIQPEEKADLRAEVSSVVLQVLKENGDAVKKGDLLVLLDDTAIRDSLISAQESERAAGLSLAQAERQYERYKKLKASGMVSTQSLEDAETKRNVEQSNLADAKARMVLARQQLQRTEIRAPFAGIVSDRKVSKGDTAQLGKELIKVIDPSSLRFEGLVSADTVNHIKAGQKVSFRINGYPGKIFNGLVKQINPQANPITRQVEVLVAFTGTQPDVSGLYAEGQVEASNETMLMIPDAAFVRNGDKVIAWKFKDNVIRKTDIKLGSRDKRSGYYIVQSGLQNGDLILRSPNTTLVDGQKAGMGNKASATTSAPQPAQ